MMCFLFHAISLYLWLQQGAANCISICQCVNNLVFPLPCHSGMQGEIVDIWRGSNLKQRQWSCLDIPSTTTIKYLWPKKGFACWGYGNTQFTPVAFPAHLERHANIEMKMCCAKIHLAQNMLMTILLLPILWTLPAHVMYAIRNANDNFSAGAQKMQMKYFCSNNTLCANNANHKLSTKICR
jgi:hypothetical protein